MSTHTAGRPSAAVVVATYRRPEHVRTCLQKLREQTIAPDETVVVDASPDSATAEVVAQFPEVVYLRNTRGPGTLATSRNLGFSGVTSDVVAFIDDDAYAHPDWLEKLLDPYRDPTVGGVGGRALNGLPGEEQMGTGQIGMFLPNGTLTGNFAADPGRPIEVDHLIGANMSYRRKVLAGLGGIHDAYPGTCLREESDIALRVKRAGWRLIFAPDARVDHLPGPYAKGRRFDVRYTYYGQRNHMVLLTRTVGVLSPQYRRYLTVAARQARAEVKRAAGGPLQVRRQGLGGACRTVAGGVLRASAVGAGVGVGIVAGWQDRLASRRPDGQACA